MKPGDKKTLHCPENLTLHGALCTILAEEPWGWHVATAAAATGRYRAGFWELANPEKVPQAQKDHEALPAYYEGTPCDTCGCLTLRRTGPCLTCDTCGDNSGC